MNRVTITKPSMKWLMQGMICRTKSFKRYQKLLKRSEAKLNKELDILNVVKSIRRMNASTFG